MGKSSRRAARRRLEAARQAAYEEEARDMWEPIDHELNALLERRFGDELSSHQRVAAVNGFRVKLGANRDQLVDLIEDAPADWTYDRFLFIAEREPA